MSRNRALSSALVFAAQLIQAGNLPAQAAEKITEPAIAQPDMASMERLPQDNAVILSVIVNGLGADPGEVFLQDDEGNLYASEAFLAGWNLKPGDLRINSPDGTVYYSLASNGKLSYQWNHERAELVINAQKDAFRSNLINIGEMRITDIAPYTTGGYLNYDMAFTQGDGPSTHGGFFDMAFFSGKGLLTNSFIASDTSHARLMTSWQMDKIDQNKTLLIGDTYNTASAWGRGVLFGGIQYGTNFDLRPDYIPFATPSVLGNALLPSTVDVYVNNALRSRQQVNAGPFEIRNLPVITGAGDMQIIVKDLLGREQVMTQPFYVNPILLRSGVSTDSIEFGWQRRNYGLQSNDYGDPFGTATYRIGLSNQLTTEAHLEVQSTVRTAGGTVAAMLPSLSSVVETSLALSNATGLSNGSLASLRYNYLGRHWSFNAKAQVNNNDFRQLGSDPANLTRKLVTTQLSVPVGTGTLSVNYLRRHNQGDSLTRIISANYSQRIFDSLLASFTLIKPIAGGGETIAQLTLTRVFGNKNVGSATLDSQTGDAGLYTDYQQPTPRESGTGYRLAALTGGAVNREEAQLTRNESFGSFEVEAVRVGDTVSTREMAQGSIATVGDGLAFSRSLDQGFAIVKTGDIEGVPVTLENQVVAHTGKHGRAMVSNVQAYRTNLIGIDPLALPLESTVGAVEQTVMPRRRGAVLVEFDVRRMRSAALIIKLPDGALLPPWTPVTVIGMKSEYITGNRGEVSVELPYEKDNLVIAHLANGQKCAVSVNQPAANSVAPFLGPLPCTLNH